MERTHLRMHHLDIITVKANALSGNKWHCERKKMFSIHEKK